MKFYANREKNQLMIYVIIAYGITYVLGLLMWYGYGKGLDLSAFPNAQMLYPAAGVMMAYLITRKGDKNSSKMLFDIFFRGAYGSAGCLYGGLCSGAEKYRSDGHTVFSVDADPAVRYDRRQRYFLDSSLGIRQRKTQSLWTEQRPLEYICSYDPVVYWIISSQICDCQRSGRPAF